MRDGLWTKGIVVGIIMLFIGASITPNIFAIKMGPTISVDKRVWDPMSQVWVNEIIGNIGNSVVFQITIINIGNVILTSVNVQDNLPSAMTYNGDATPPPTSYSGHNLNWNLGTIQIGGSKILSFSVNLISAGTCINNAIATTSEGSSSQDTATVIVVGGGSPLVANAGGPYSGYTSESVWFTGSATGGVPPYTYQWDFDNDGLYDDATGANPTYTWSSAGTFPIRLKVIDSRGTIATTSASVTISNQNRPPNKPKINVCTSDEIYYLTFIKATVGDPDGDSLLHDIYWGDGSSSLDLPTGTSLFSHTYNKLGKFYITMRSKDEHGSISELSDPFEINIKYTGLNLDSEPKTSKCVMKVDPDPSVRTNDFYNFYTGTFSVKYMGKNWFQETPDGQGRWELYFSSAFLTSENKGLDYGEVTPMINSLEIGRTSDEDCVPMSPCVRIGGENTKIMTPDPDPNPFTAIANAVMKDAVMLMLDVLTVGGSFFIDAADAVNNLEDSAYEADVKVQTINDGLVNKASCLESSYLRIQTDQQSNDNKWQLDFHAGALTTLKFGLSTDQLLWMPTDLDNNGQPYSDFKSYYICDYGDIGVQTEGDGAITFWGTIPPPLPAGEEPKNFIVAIYCPVNVTVYTPSGTYISKDIITYPIPGANYSEKDINGDGKLDKEINIPQGWPGNYSIYVQPQKDANPDDTFSIDIISEGKTIHLVKDMKISDLNPNTPFIYTKEEPNWGPTIQGPTIVKKDHEYQYKLNSTILYGLGAYEYLIVWGDDSPDQLVTGPFEADQVVSVNHSWSEVGQYIVKVKVKDQFGEVSDWSEPLQVTNLENIPPVADFSYSPALPTNLDVIHFTDASTDSDGTIASWSWDFGDGGTSALQTPTHQYANGGTYSVTLTVIDNDGASNSISKSVAVISLDQSQTKYFNNFWMFSTYSGAQSFTPTMTILSYVEVFMRKVGKPIGDVVVSVRSSLTGVNLVSLSIPASQIPTTFGWVKFDFSDLRVTPGSTYYLVLRTSGGSILKYYSVGYGSGNLYKNGALWTSITGGAPWYNNLGYDLCFKTYGFS